MRNWSAKVQQRLGTRSNTVVARPQTFSDDARLIVSEPLGDVAGVWNEMPESTHVYVSSAHAELLPFQPEAPASSVPAGA